MEAAGNARVSKMPEHPHLQREVILRPGLTLSRLYDTSLHDYWKSKQMTYFGLVTVASAVAKALLHMHTHDTGHFDVKPENVLVKWAHTLGHFKGAMVVLADFGLCHELKNGSYGITHTHTYTHVHAHTCR